MTIPALAVAHFVLANDSLGRTQTALHIAAALLAHHGEAVPKHIADQLRLLLSVAHEELDTLHGYTQQGLRALAEVAA